MPLQRINHLHSWLLGCFCVLAFLQAPLTAVAATPDAAELAQRSGCLGCHQGVKHGIGPSYQAVANKYAGQTDAATRLAQHIVQGTGTEGLGWMKAGMSQLVAMPANANVSPADAQTLAQWILTVQKELDHHQRFVSDHIKVTGSVAQALKLTVQDLRAFAPEHIVEMPVVWHSGGERDKTVVLRGVLLRHIVERAKVVTHSNHDVKKMAIIASANDDYRIVFSWSEVFNSPNGDGALVYFEKDGKPLAAEEGQIAMISTNDLRSGARHVKWLSALEVRKIVD